MNLISLISEKILEAKMVTDPVDHIVIDDLLPVDFAEMLSSEFGDYESGHWHKYSNSIEEKKTCNQWNLFSKATYKYFQIMCSSEINLSMSIKFGVKVEADVGLHGGGQHIHSKMGNLNPHLDYSIHPKLEKERRLNAIYYLTDKYKEEDGGHFGLWGNDSNFTPGDLQREYSPKFNRLVLFNTSQNSWHGLSRIYAPEGVKFRKSLASYYVSEPRTFALSHTRALFSPRENQKSDQKVMAEIKARSDEVLHKSVYVIEKNEKSY